VIAFPALTPLPGQTACKAEPEVKEKVAEEIDSFHMWSLKHSFKYIVKGNEA
jgi:hypothetical protein